MFTDVMIDIETNGTNPATASILQLAAVKFNLETQQVSDQFFDRCLQPIPGRGWDVSTRQWWLKQKPGILQSIEQRAEDPRAVMFEFQAWLLKDWPPTPEGVRFWSKPITFDYCFVTEYFRIFGLDQPCHYRFARDLNSFMAGLTGEGKHPEIPVEPAFDGDAHNALFDVLHQIRLLFAMKQQTTQCVILPPLEAVA